MAIDTYSLFNSKIEKEGDWRIIGRQNNYIPEDVEGVFFTYGEGASCKRVDVFGNEIDITEEEAEKYPELSPYSDYVIKSLLEPVIPK